MSWIGSLRTVLLAFALTATAVPFGAARVVAAATSTIFMADQSDLAQIYVQNLPITVSENSDARNLDISAATQADAQRSVAIQVSTVDELTAGVYFIQRAWPATPNFDRLLVVGDSIGCTGAGATLTIHEITWIDQTLSTLSLSIVCPVPDGGTAAVELRINAPGSIPAHGVSPEQLGFPKVIAGVESSTKAVSFKSIGSADLSPTAVTIGGPNADDFTIASDTCTGASLAPDEACTVAVLFDPADGASFTRTATVTLVDNTLNGYRTVRMVGTIKRPTTLTLESLNNPATAPGELAKITPLISPSTASGKVQWYVNGVKSSFTVGNGSNAAWYATQNGTQSIQAAFEGTNDFAPSTSLVLVQVVRTQTSIELVAEPSTTDGVGVYDVTATVRETAGSSPGGTLAIWDDTTDTKLGELVLDDRTYLDLHNLSFAGAHNLRATYTGVAPYLLGSTATLTVDGPPASAPGVPTQVSATAGEGSATIVWKPPTESGGSEITGYVAKATPGGQTCSTTANQCTIHGLGSGTSYTFTVAATNAVGTGGDSNSSNAVSPLPNVAPTSTAPASRFATGTGLDGGRHPLRVSWSGADAGSGIARYELSQSTDSGAWTSVSTTLTSSVLYRNLASGHTYRFRVRGVDKVGNVGAWAYGATFRLTGISQASSAVRYAGTWATSTSTTWWGGTARSSSRAGSTASYTFTGRSIALVGLKAANRGKANVYINGVLKATVDLYSATTKKQLIVWSANYSTSATRTITIKVLGTAGRPRVDVDGFIVGS